MKKIYKGLIDDQVIYFLYKRDPKWMKEIVTGITFRTNIIPNLVIINSDSDYYQKEIMDYITDKTNNYNEFYDFLMNYKNKDNTTSNTDNKKKTLKVHIKVLKRDRFTGEIKQCKVVNSNREGELK